MADIEIVNLEKKIYHPGTKKIKQELFHGLNFRFRSNKIYAITGPEKTGKTMFLRLILRLNDPDKGAIFFNGINTYQYDLDEYRDYFSAAMEKNLFFTESVNTEISYISQFNRDIPPANIKSRVHTLSSLVKLPHEFKEQNPQQLDVAYQAKIKTARALFSNADCFLFDNTFDFFPLEECSEILENLKSICRQEEKMIIFTTNKKELLAMADEKLIFRKEF